MTRISVISWGSKPTGEEAGMEESPGVNTRSSSYTCLALLVVISSFMTIGTSIWVAVTISKLMSGHCAPHAGTTNIQPNVMSNALPPVDVHHHGPPAPVNVHHHGPIPSGQNLDDKKPYSFNDMFDPNLVPMSPQGQWAGNKQVTYLNDRLELILHHVDNDTKTVIMTNETFIEYNTYYYTLSPDQKYILITYDTVTELQDLNGFAKHKIYERETGELLSFPNDDAMKDKIVMHVIWTPKGSGLSFVFDNDLYYQKDPTETPERLTSSGSNIKIRNGISFWNYNGVLQSNAIWWSADMTLLAYGEFDSTEITLSEHPIYKQQVYPDMFRQVYLKAGDAAHFSRSRLLVIDMTDMTNSTRPRKTVPPPLEFRDKEYYFYQVLWRDDNVFGVGWTNRIQKRSIVEFCDTSMVCTRNHDMTVENGWFTGPHLLQFVDGGSHYLAILPKVVGDEGRYRQVAMVSSTDGTVTYLTDKAWEVYYVNGYDSENHLVYYTGTAGLQLEQHVFRVGTPDADPSMRAVKCLTCDIDVVGCDYTAASFSPCTQNYLLQCLGPDIPTYYLKWTNNDTKSYTIMDNANVKAAMATRKLPTREFHKLNIGDGYTGWAEFILPPGMVKDGSIKYPVIFYPYAGPHGTTQADYSYKANSPPGGSWDYHLASGHNVVVVRLNGRGSGGRGDEFLFQLYRQLGTKEITDQIDGAIYLKDNFPYVNSSQLAIWGWSYGGFTTAHVMGHDSDVFTCGISVAPVTNFRHYYSGYTERYMDLDTAEDNAAGYNLTDVIRKVENFRNKKYMVAHGTVDDNVHFQNAIELINALSKAQILFRTQLYVDQNHGIREPHLRRHLFLSMTDFYIRDCLGL